MKAISALGCPQGSQQDTDHLSVPKAFRTPVTRHRFAVRLETTVWEMEGDQEMLVTYRHVVKLQKRSLSEDNCLGVQYT